VFQTAVSQITADYGSLDSAINDLPAEPLPFNPGGSPTNYCERQGRCVLGCLPDARQTLSKQLLAAIVGAPALLGQPARPPLLPNMSLQALAEVDMVAARPEGGYEILYRQRDAAEPDRFVQKRLTANVVVVAAGCINTNEILLRSKASGALPHVSGKLGYGFSTNGDSLQFLPRTHEPTYLTRGTMMTSFGRFHTEASGDGPDPRRYHAIEDNGLPRVFAMLVGVGQPLIRALTKGQGRRPTIFLARTMLLWFIRHFLVGTVRAFIPNTTQYQEYFRSEDQALSNMMIVATMGRDEACGQFRLGDPTASETPLRVRRTDGKEFYEDPIYREISDTLGRLAPILAGSRRARFQNPFFDLGRTTGKLLAPVPLTHPLGGCRMAASPDEGVVDEYGRVFDASKSGAAPLYDGLYVADASIIPTSLGINPTLTISAVALRVGAQIVKDHYPVAPSTA
jgi:cholesterol oxidase